MELVGNLIGFGKGAGRKSKLGFASILGSRLLQWTIRDYGISRFEMHSFCSKSSTFDFSLKGLIDWVLVFLILLASWLFLPPLKLELIEVGLLKWPSLDFSLDPHLDFGVQLAKQAKYHLQDAKNHSFKKYFLYTVFLTLGSH